MSPSRRAVLRALALAALAPAQAQPRAPLVAAAADLQFALTEIAARFEADTGQRVQFAFGSSGNFARQIRQGAPFELFLSADEDFVLALAEAGLTRDRGALYAIGRLVLYAPMDSPLALDPALEGLRAGWSAVRRFAIANPEHAPYGRAARQALQALGLWEFVQPKLVLGENIAQTAQFITTGNAQAGLIALSLALAPELKRQGRHVLLPQSLHAPLRQRMVLLRHASQTAQHFYSYLMQPAARDILRRYGFELPGE
ncbi:MAG: molybdate ABC transporter substrate-binding protein [Burkholderiaceae bacterium]|nr:molybdate ABC transporter substrate-binding protein [Burkholderiaceae bacterium]